MSNFLEDVKLFETYTQLGGNVLIVHSVS